MRNLRDIADELVSRIDSSDGGGHDVADEPRVAKGSGKQSGEWKAGGQSGSNADGDGCPNGHVVVPMNVTAYTSGPESTGKKPGNPNYGKTASGAIAGPGTIAAPRSYMKKRMFVPGYGWGTVQDTGRLITGNHLDVWFETVEEARQWRRRYLDVIVCK